MDQEPRTRKYLTNYTVQDTILGSGAQWGNPLLEEYVDGFHFILELGIEILFEDFEMIYLFTEGDEEGEIEKRINKVFSLMSRFTLYKNEFAFIN
ncbi:dimeric dUTPase (all-alpha-NTP-PPase superfamily) [Cytobacillus purgationiresistens]|uniref:Dimeric dUTPase (All-alpha-NTP-PPase superfamily) n=1 Tax=Cytobacillus purgationiresistens TaxID=863449 RepID=A0ABU0ADA5_9BACI|nr:dimeric dUTPase (all-alpha-NTP-PPase superfamily) [Cytobacillus purgationiresistens]